MSLKLAAAGIALWLLLRNKSQVQNISLPSGDSFISGAIGAFDNLTGTGFGITTSSRGSVGSSGSKCGGGCGCDGGCGGSSASSSAVIPNDPYSYTPTTIPVGQSTPVASPTPDYSYYYGYPTRSMTPA